MQENPAIFRIFPKHIVDEWHLVGAAISRPRLFCTTGGLTPPLQ